MKKFIKVTAVLGLFFSVLGFGIAWGAKLSGARWNRRAIQEYSVVIPEIVDDIIEAEEGRSFDADFWENEAEMIEWAQEEASAFDDENMVSFSAKENLSISISRGNVEVIRGDTDKILITCDSYQTMQDLIRCYTEDDEVDIAIKGVKNREPSVEVFLPAGYRFESAEIKVAAGSCFVEELNAGELDLNVAAGALEIMDSHAAELDFQCGAGSITYSGRIDREVEGNCKAGEVVMNLYQPKDSFNYELQGTGGEICIGELTVNGLTFQKTLDHHAAGKADLECAAGSIRMEFLE